MRVKAKLIAEPKFEEEDVTVEGYGFHNITVPSDLPSRNVTVNGRTYKEYYFTYNIPTNDTYPAVLPTGKVLCYDENGNISNNSGDTGIWRRYTYFFKEYDNGNTEKNASSTYDPYEQTKGVDKPFVLNNARTEASLEEGIIQHLYSTA